MTSGRPLRAQVSPEALVQLKAQADQGPRADAPEPYAIARERLLQLYRERFEASRKLYLDIERHQYGHVHPRRTSALEEFDFDLEQHRHALLDSRQAFTLVEMSDTERTRESPAEVFRDASVERQNSAREMLTRC